MIRVLAGAIAATVLLAGCTSGSRGAKAAGDDVLQRVLSKGEVRVAECLGFAPFGYYDKDNKPIGYDIDLAQEMAKSLGVKLKIVDVTANNRIPSLQTDKVDVVFCNFTRTPERAKQINFTDPYVVAAQILLVKKNSGIKGIGDLTGKAVAITRGTPTGDILKNTNPKAKPQDFDSSIAGVTAVKQGQADAIIEDSNFLTFQSSLDPSLVTTHDSLVPLEYNGFGVKQNQFNWLEWLNQFIFEMNASGKNKELYKKWFGQEPAFSLQPSY